MERRATFGIVLVAAFALAGLFVSCEHPILDRVRELVNSAKLDALEGFFDVNGDGYGDYIIGEPGYDVLPDNQEGRVLVYSGNDGSIIWEKVGQTDGEAFGEAVGDAGDVNGDGYSDFIVGTSAFNSSGFLLGLIMVYSGVDGSQLYRKEGENHMDEFGQCVSGAGDVNGDGYADFVVGAPNFGSNTGKFYLYSGVDGTELLSVEGSAPNEYLGWSVGWVGDMNLDGRDEFIVGARGGAGGNGSARVYYYNGSAYDVMHIFSAPDANNVNFGIGVNGCGDVDGDGRPDVIIGDSDYSDVGVGGKVYVYRGSYWTLIDSVTGTADTDGLGVSVSGADLNRDGYSDYIMGNYEGNAHGNYTGQILVFSGKTKTVLYDKTGENSLDYYGFSISAGGDINRDGYPDFIVGASGYINNARDGKVYVYSGKDGTEIITRSRTGSSQDSFGSSVSNGR